MPTFNMIKNEAEDIEYIETDLTGKVLLETAPLNKGTAFSEEERQTFGLLGQLPQHIEILEDQAERCYRQYQSCSSSLAKNIYLKNVQNQNETLFYKIVTDHLEEMLPIIYTPTIGEAVEKFSLELRKPRGLFISYPDRNRIEEILGNRPNKTIDLIVVTDGEGVLGIGDQGIGGIDICIGKSSVYTLCAGINPNRILPIQLDVGTNNKKLLDDPLYLGWRHARISDQAYDNFITAFIAAIKNKLPNAYLHWEDFGKENARKNLNRFREELCTFNDDMQGTGIVASSCILSALSAFNQKLTAQQIVFFGAGTAATGIADQLCSIMIRDGLSESEARERIWMLGSKGLLTDSMSTLTSFQKIYAKSSKQISEWELDNVGKIDLRMVVKHVHPSILIGCSAASGAFTEEIIQEMAHHTEHPIILPLSNPTSKSEAVPKDLLKWTKGKALIATGSPFESVKTNGKTIRIAQCNNAFAFPGLGLGIIASKAKRLTDNMIWVACLALTDYAPIKQNKTAPLVPDLSSIKKISCHIAEVVAKQAVEDGAADKIDIGEMTFKLM